MPAASGSCQDVGFGNSANIAYQVTAPNGAGDSGTIEILDVADFLRSRAYDLPDSTSSVEKRSGTLTVSLNGQQLSVISDHGVCIIVTVRWLAS